MQVNWREYKAIVTHGESRTLQDVESDVSLTIPKGSTGVYMTRVHTDPFFSRTTCIVGPIVDIACLPKDVESSRHFNVLKIPHCVSNTGLWPHIKVTDYVVASAPRRKLTQGIPGMWMEEEQDDYYEIDERFVTIYTNLRYAFYRCELSNPMFCNSAPPVVFVFGHLEYFKERKRSEVQLKTFLCSNLYNIRDFYEVGILSKFSNQVLNYFLVNLEAICNVLNVFT